MHTTADLNAGSLAGITHIKLSEDLTEFPQALFTLVDSLEVLDLSGNKLSELPADFGRFHKLKILFVSNNEFEILPPVIADCPALTMIGFKANKIHTVPEGSLPVNTRWLILTDNKIAALPESMGELHQLQKLMLAGNELTTLPASMRQCEVLELVRISANQFTEFPEFLLHLPKLAWLAFSGNPFCQPFEYDPLPAVAFDDLVVGAELGQGASGVISRARWVDTSHQLAIQHNTVAVKKFKGEVTSDGYPQDELNACIAAGRHVNLVELIAQIDTPQNLGLVMALIGENFRNLGLPPSFDSCTRDHFTDGFSLTINEVQSIAQQVADTMQHLAKKEISHGDLYAHNILINEEADVLFGDFGAASNYASLSENQARVLQSIEVRAFGCLLDDLLGVCSDCEKEPGRYELLERIRNRCMGPSLQDRPMFDQISAELTAMA